MARTARIQRAITRLYGAADHWNFREDDDNYFEQPGKLFNLMSPENSKRLFENTARNMKVLTSIFNFVIL